MSNGGGSLLTRVKWTKANGQEGTIEKSLSPGQELFVFESNYAPSGQFRVEGSYSHFPFFLSNYQYFDNTVHNVCIYAVIGIVGVSDHVEIQQGSCSLLGIPPVTSSSYPIDNISPGFVCYKLCHKTCHKHKKCQH